MRNASLLNSGIDNLRKPIFETERFANFDIHNENIRDVHGGLEFKGVPGKALGLI